VNEFISADREYLTRAAGDLRRSADEVVRGMSVAVVYGPVSAEDQLYLAKCPPGQLSVNALSATLAELGTRSAVLDPCRASFIQDVSRFDVVLSNLHGPFGEDGRLQGLLDYLRMPYCGSGVAASAIAADKVLCKRMMEALAVPTPAWSLAPDTPAGWPVMVKPRMGGSSVGMSLVRDERDFDLAVARAGGESSGHSVLIEEHIPGVPVTVGMLELPGGAIVVFPPLATVVHSGDFYDADAKLDVQGEGTVSCTTADLPRPALEALRKASVRLWEGLGCNGMARADFIAAPDGKVYALEVNTTPGMSFDSNFMMAAGLCGMRHGDVLMAIIHEAMTRPRYDVPLPVPDFSAGS
jgi:D-alanine-D-alanine ligase